ncbi:hypothetical protein AMATHDRAFT_75022 [Amanita thiersii Skay4041]|uniref:F-box domain-containing protein n=1 Tax=Amanita thiersii Skay4041 TaxID=703135 RepID=A0A2A9NUA8_9AGAR|nr:hypothetical protein AMATHDRAFT_75022 [Amanita thiersii Skay4041]
MLNSLPSELIAEILGNLDLASLITTSYLSRRFHTIVSDSSLNPWRPPILRNLRLAIYEDSLKHLSIRSIVPRHNWIEILSLARPTFILFEATLPNLKASEWEECFSRRFLPGWKKWKRDGSWKEAFLKLLYRVWHRSVTYCSSDEAWTKFIVLNRNGSANELEASSRNFNPFIIFNDIKLQTGLGHLETQIRVVVQLADVRILAFGTLSKRTRLSVNPNAHGFLHPPGIEKDNDQIQHPYLQSNDLINDYGVYPSQSRAGTSLNHPRDPVLYTRLRYPLPALIHENYPFYTPGGGDNRWFGSGEVEEDGLQWVGRMLIVAQILGSNDGTAGQESEQGRQQYASITWRDLWAIAPWLEERVTKKINGPGLGIE